MIIDDSYTDDSPVDSVASPQPNQPTLQPIALPQPQPTIDWFKWILIGLVAFLLFNNRGGCSVVRDDRIVIDDKGKFALILEDKSEDGQSKLSKGQASAINSVAVKAWCDEHDVAFRKIATQQNDLSGMEPVWQSLRDKAASAPSLTISDAGRAVTGTLPDGSDATIKAIEGAIK